MNIRLKPSMTEAKQKPSVLLISQSASVVKSIEKLLASYFNLVKVSDTEDAWAYLVESPETTVVMCELQLSIDSFGFLERLRSAGNNRLAAKPVLVLVGESDTEACRESAFQLGATDFINMPFSSAELTARVRLHAQFFVQHSQNQSVTIHQDTSLGALQQLTQENYFESRLNQELIFSARHRVSVGVGKIKLANVQALVADKGKSTATSVIQTVANIIKKTMRNEDTLCYLGQAQFNLLFPATNGIGTAIGLRRIMDSVTRHRISIDGDLIAVKLAGAVYSCVPTKSTTLDMVMEVLRRRLNEAVAEGENSIVSSVQAGEKIAISVERALQLLERDDPSGLSDHARALMIEILPLIEYADGVLDLGLAQAGLKLREKLAAIE
ncbi:MAG: diguanylate cyclase (GGDEF)-like protein [Gammaproteobacteria bacterium]